MARSAHCGSRCRAVPGSRMPLPGISSDLAAIGLSAERVTYGARGRSSADRSGRRYVQPGLVSGTISCQVTIFVQCRGRCAGGCRHSERWTVSERMRLLGEAEIKLQNLRNFVPLANPVRWSLPRDGLLGFTPNARGWHPLQYLGRRYKIGIEEEPIMPISQEQLDRDGQIVARHGPRPACGAATGRGAGAAARTQLSYSRDQRFRSGLIRSSVWCRCSAMS